MVWATVVAYDNEAVGSNPPGGLADFFDVKKYPGKRGLRRDPWVIMEWALMADGVAPDKVYETLATEEGATARVLRTGRDQGQYRLVEVRASSRSRCWSPGRWS